MPRLLATLPEGQFPWREGMCTQTYVCEYQIMSADNCATSALKGMSIFSLYLVMKIEKRKRRSLQRQILFQE